MPNTLAHFGAQGFLTRRFLPWADPKWICLGCLLPDVPWIFQRIVNGLFPGILDPYTVRLYAVVQASLIITLILCGALAVLTKTPGKIFGILSLNVVLHLVLDSLQTKWANGVHLFAPFSWELLNFGLFWPESIPTYALTLLGLIFIGWNWRHSLRQPVEFSQRLGKGVFQCLALLVLYFTVPLFLLEGPAAKNSHFVKTLRNVETRVGRPLEIDRNDYIKKADGDVVTTFAREVLRVKDQKLDHSAKVSVRGKFIKPDTIQILQIHEHSRWFRDVSTYIAIIILSTMWGVALTRYWMGKTIDSEIEHTTN